MNSITRDATDMYSLFNASGVYPEECYDKWFNVSTVMYDAQHYAYDRNASLGTVQNCQYFFLYANSIQEGGWRNPP